MTRKSRTATVKPKVTERMVDAGVAAFAEQAIKEGSNRDDVERVIADRASKVRDGVRAMILAAWLVHIEDQGVPRND